jgi:hypothetical protein
MSRYLFAFLALLPAPALAAVAAKAEPPPEPLLGQPAERFLYLMLIWAVIVPLVVVLRDRCRVADDLFRMGHGEGTRGGKEDGEKIGEGIGGRPKH